MDDIIKNGIKTKVLLISATPVNINLRDLRNQIYFITEDKDDAFKQSMGIHSLKETIAVAQREFTHWADHRKNPERNVKDLLEKLPSSFFKLLDELTIARSRKHIQSYYKEEMNKIGAFPERLKPVSIFPQIDTKGRFMSYDKLNDEISNYQLSLFNPSKYVKDEYKDVYEERAGTKKVKQLELFPFTQSEREHCLIGMMKVNFMKRLESSIRSFAITMNRTISKIEDLEGRIRRFKQFQSENPDLDFDDLADIDREDNEKVNPLQPYFLVYVRDDGIVRYTFTQAKQILEMFRLLCSGKTVPYEALCRLFDEQTNNGSNMSHYNELLKKSVDAIVSTFKKKTLYHLLSGRNAILPDKQSQVSETTDFELITWLVIK